MRLDDKVVVFKVYKIKNPPVHSKDLCLIKIMEVDECWVIECKQLMTSLNYLIVCPVPPINLGIKKLKEE